MIIPVMAISNLVLTQQIYSEEINGAHAYNRDRVPVIIMLSTVHVKNNYIGCPLRINTIKCQRGKIAH